MCGAERLCNTLTRSLVRSLKDEERCLFFLGIFGREILPGAMVDLIWVPFHPETQSNTVLWLS